MPPTPPDRNRTDPQAHPQRLRVAHLNPNAATPFLLRPDGETRAAIAEELGVEALPKLEFRGEVRAEGAQGWRLDGQLSARVTQACVVSLKPVRSEISEPVRLRYSPHATTPEGDEVEMGDETLEPLGAFIDLTAAMIEALALALPPYPRAQGAELTLLPDESEPAEDRRRPFAGLDKLLKGDG